MKYTISDYIPRNYGSRMASSNYETAFGSSRPIPRDYGSRMASSNYETAFLKMPCLVRGFCYF